ncbi:nucleotidyl transferase AbiEii/AbiGii toxin family protein [Actimicrobium sp. CCI2.3]|uniref:nucleotidyl transferase AbiEii/AbiGii toxin family protein n=1 Tax=Actimicrobium sp. CCI2.3 TaxID=3048616 RepID=UPI002AB3C5B9|nr:nucleotidyl transferase AbiEii/AbiGii toxin family protein [Actimicrobium sp. CCI2.3]MDY7575468.1 nucleotidyl transferase AbiEii/AbiGii toxin family protein [Actimicrobium sp. CCI2.3]MEB0024043.1 nucleotidyl transferase AbiEii/AbiGii toxin family protein [Actimicrobium sp. CCI2.3]
MDTSKLRPDTGLVWEKIREHPDLHGFVLIGGTALTMRIGHRVSEDLDFAYPATRLPDRQLQQFLRAAADTGLRLVLNQNPLDVDDAIDAGNQLEHYQQDYLANNTVKVTFFAPEPELNAALGFAPAAPLRVATLDELFASKALVCAERSKTRDWFDLYTLMTAHGYAMQDLHGVFAKLGILPKFAIASTRLRKCVPLISDEGYEQLLANPPSLQTMREYFNEAIDKVEVALAKSAFGQLADRSTGPAR